MVNDPDAGVRYLFIVARRNPDILARVQERLLGDPRIDVIADRRSTERRRSSTPHPTERRGGDRRRPTNVWNDLTIYPTLVAQRYVDSYTELERRLANSVRDTQALSVENDQLREMAGELERRLEAMVTGDQQLRAENTRLREEIVELQRRLGTLAAAEAEFKAEVAALLGQADQTLGGLITKFQRLTEGDHPPQKEPRLRSL